MPFANPARRNALIRASASLILCLGLLGFCIPASAQIAFRAAANNYNAAPTNITLVANGTATSAANGNIDCNYPTGWAAGDLLLCVIESHDAVGVSMAATWTRLVGSAAAASNTAAVFWRIAATGDDTTPLITHTAGDAIIARMTAFRGVDNTSPFEGTASMTASAADTTTEAAAITSTTTGAMQVFTVHTADDGAAVSALGGWTNAYQSSTNLGTDATVELWYRALATPAAQAAISANRAGASVLSNGGMLVLHPASATGIGVTVNLPTGTVAGDIMIASVAARPDTSTITPPAGWTLIRRTDQTAGGSSGGTVASYYKFATSAEPSSYTWYVYDSGGSKHLAAGIVSFSGVDTTTPINLSGGNVTASASTHSATAISPTVNNTMLVGVHMILSAYTWTPPTGMTEAVDRPSAVSIPDAVGISLEMSYVAQAATGSTGAKVATSAATGSNVDNGAAQLIALTPAALDHVEFVHDSSALTCTAEAITVIGCTTSASCYGSTPTQTTNPFTVTPSAIAGAQWCSDALCATPITGSILINNGTVIYLRKSSAGVARAAGTVTGANNGTVQCRNTLNSTFNATTACDITYEAAGLLVNIPNHLSCAPQTVTIQAVRSNATGTTCIPAFANVNRDLTMYLSYLNPATGTRTANFNYVTSAGGATSTIASLSTNSGSPSTLTNLYWNASAIATLTNFIYPDAGQIQLNPVVTGSGSTSGLTLTAISGHQPIVAPADFLISVTPGNKTAGSPFNATITARNSCAPVAATPNFNATVTVASSNPLPALGNATHFSTGVTGFSSGALTNSFTWNEVGSIDLTASLSSYLGWTPASPITSVATTVTPFWPAYFDVFINAHGCNTFTYGGTPLLAGQPFSVRVKAKRFGANLNDNTNTANFAGATWGRAVALSDAGAGMGTGTLNNNSFAGTDFVLGIATRNDVGYRFADKLMPPYTLAMRATASTISVDSIGHTEESEIMRSGRLRLFNAFGSARKNLTMNAQTQYWNGNTWIVNSDDSCTTLTASNLYLNSALTTPSALNIAAGAGTITLTAPATGATLSVDIAADLDPTSIDNSCLTTHGGTAAAMPWLRSLNGNCAATYDRDPSARATFGVYSPESQKTIHVRELF